MPITVQHGPSSAYVGGVAGFAGAREGEQEKNKELAEYLAMLQQQNRQHSLGLGALQVDQRNLELGRDRLALDQELGRGGLDIDRQRQALAEKELAQQMLLAQQSAYLQNPYQYQNWQQYGQYGMQAPPMIAQGGSGSRFR